MYMCIYCTDYLGSKHEKTVDSGYFWTVTPGLGMEWEWEVYSLSITFFEPCVLGREAMENNCFLENLKPMQ